MLPGFADLRERVAGQLDDGCSGTWAGVRVDWQSKGGIVCCLLL